MAIAIHDFRTYRARLRAAADARAFGSDKNEPIALTGTFLKNCDFRRFDGSCRLCLQRITDKTKQQENHSGERA
jgi:hypothetical protein